MTTATGSFCKTIGGTDYDYGRSIIQTRDGGYAICGRTNSFGAGNYDVYVVKLDGSGNVQWTRTIGGRSNGYGRSIIQTHDGGYAICGSTYSYGAGGNDVYVVKLNGSDNMQWTRTIGGLVWDYGSSIIQTRDGGYAICGYTNSYGAGGEDVYAVKLDGNANVQWTRTIGGPNNDYGYSIIQTSDGGYTICGCTNSYGAGGDDVYVVKLDECGNVQWTRTIGGPNNDYGLSIIQTNDGGYAICGYTNSYGAGGNDVYVVKLNGNDTLQWTRTIGGENTDEGWSIIQTRDGGYTICGETASFGAGWSDVYVVKLDNNGNLCPGGCQVNSGGTVSSGDRTGSGGSPTSPSAIVNSGGKVGSGGTLTTICPQFFSK